MEFQETPPVQPAEIKLTERQEKLSDEQMGDLLAAFGNNEAKALTLLLMSPGIIYTRPDIHRTVIRAQGKNPSWRINQTGPFQYCEHSLAPIGLVAREITDPVLGIYGYEKTDYGESVGDPLAALLLEFSLRNELSLYALFGSTTSSSKGKIGEENSKKRSPLTRFKIFRELLKEEFPIRAKDLAQRVNEDADMIDDHLVELISSGVITMESIGSIKPYSLYSLSTELPQTPPKPYRSRPLTNEVWTLLKSEPNTVWTINKVMERLGRNKGYHNISAVLNNLAKQRYLEKGKFGSDVRSQISLTEGIKGQLSELISLIEAFQNQDPEIIARGKDLTSKFHAGNTVEIAQLMAKARETSPFANNQSVDSTLQIILSIVSQNPHTTAMDIRGLLEKGYEKKLSMGSLRGLLRRLKSEGSLIAEENKQGLHKWSVNPQAFSEASNSSHPVV